MRTVVNLLPTMTSRDHIDNNASNISWHTSMISFLPLIKTKGSKRKKTIEEKEPDSNLTRART